MLLDHPSVQQAVTFALPHPKLGEEVAAAVVLREGREAGERDLRSFVAERLADFKVPRKIVFRDQIPEGPHRQAPKNRFGREARTHLNEPARSDRPRWGRSPGLPITGFSTTRKERSLPPPNESDEALWFDTLKKRPIR